MADRIRVSCVQLDGHDVSEADRALDEAEAAARRAAENADVVVLPEATYPGYVLHDSRDFLEPKWWSRGLETFGEVARTSGASIVVGLIRSVNGRVRNSAAVLGPTGDLAGVTDKSFLWHFDSLWFEPGAPSGVLQLPFGETGVFVCADARMTEIPRCLAVEGARLLVDTTALVLNAGGNAQIDYMLAARAWENGSFLAVANKCGYEAGLAHYAGQSAIYDPGGEVIVRAGRDEPAIVTAEIDLARATGPRGRRRPTSYGSLTRPSSPSSNGPVDPASTRPLRIGMAQADADELRSRRELAVDLVITRRDVAAEGVLAATPDGFRFGGTRYVGGDVLQVASEKFGLLSGDQLAVPEEARCLMLEGASVLVWDRPPTDRTPIEVLRTRADENRVFLIVSSSTHGWMVIGPTGAIQAEGGGDDRLHAVLVELHPALTRSKEMAPGTDVLAHRQPERYAALTRSE
jgi:predicted amidohydrolase